MRLFLEGTPDLLELEELRRQAGEQVAGLELPVYAGASGYGGLSVRIRFIFRLPEGPLEVRPELPRTPAASTLAWYWLHGLEGLLWDEAGQVAELHARKEWGRVAGVEVIA